MPRKRQKPNVEKTFQSIIDQASSLTQEDIDEVLESTAVYGLPEEGFPFTRIARPPYFTTPWEYFDATGMPPPLVRRAYQRLWDSWVQSRGETQHGYIYPRGHPEDAPRREEWMRGAYFPGEDPYDEETWSHDLDAVMDKVDDAFGRKRGESMLGSPWWIRADMQHTDKYKFGSEDVEELRPLEIWARLDTQERGTGLYGRRRALGVRDVHVGRYRRRA